MVIVPKPPPAPCHSEEQLLLALDRLMLPAIHHVHNHKLWQQQRDHDGLHCCTNSPMFFYFVHKRMHFMIYTGSLATATHGLYSSSHYIGGGVEGGGGVEAGGGLAICSLSSKLACSNCRSAASSDTSLSTPAKFPVGSSFSSMSSTACRRSAKNSSRASILTRVKS